jgi:hypothetical protein
MKKIILFSFAVILGAGLLLADTEAPADIFSGEGGQLIDAEALKAIGAGDFSAAGIVVALIFGGIGFYAFMQGKKKKNFWSMASGAGMMGYTYFVRGTLPMIVTGVLLFALFYFKRND